MLDLQKEIFIDDTKRVYVTVGSCCQRNHFPKDFRACFLLVHVTIILPVPVLYIVPTLLLNLFQTTLENGRSKFKNSTVFGYSDIIQCYKQANLELARTNSHMTGIKVLSHQMIQTTRAFPYLPPVSLRRWWGGGTSMWWSGCFVSWRYTLLLWTHLCSKLVLMILCSYHSCTKRQGIVFCILLFHSLWTAKEEVSLSWTAP